MLITSSIRKHIRGEQIIIMKEYRYYTSRDVNYNREEERFIRYKERTAEVNRQKRNIFIVLVAFFALLFFVSGTKAETPGFENRVKMFKCVKIHYGDTLESIAKDNITPGYSSYNSLVNEIMSINNLYNDDIIAGNKIIVPYYTDVDTESEVNK